MFAIQCVAKKDVPFLIQLYKSRKINVLRHEVWMSQETHQLGDILGWYTLYGSARGTDSEPHVT